MIPYMVRLLGTKINNGTTPRDWKKATIVPIHKGNDRSVVESYRPVILTSVVSKHMEHVIAGYIRQVWEDRDWLYEGQHGFRPGYSCESQIISLSGHIRLPRWSSQAGHDNNRFFESFLSSPPRLLKKIAVSGVDSKVVWIRGFLIDVLRALE